MNENVVYKGSWYTGYVAGMLAKTVASGGASKFAKSNKYIKRVRKLAKKTPPGRLASYIATKRANAKAKVAGQLVSGSTYAGGKVVRGAKTVGSAVRTNKLVDRAGVDTSKLSSGQASSLRYYLKRGDDDEVEEVRSIDDDEVGDRFSISDRCRSGNAAFASAALLTARECELDLEQEDENNVLEAVQEHDVSLADFNTFVKNLPNSEKQKLTEIIEQGHDYAETMTVVFKYKDIDPLVVNPETMADIIKELESKYDVKIYSVQDYDSGTRSGARGHTEEIKLALKKERNGVNVVAVGKTIEEKVKRVDLSKSDDGRSSKTLKKLEAEADNLINRGDIDSDGEDEMMVVESKTNRWTTYPEDATILNIPTEQKEQLVRMVRVFTKRYGKDTKFVYRTTAKEENVPKTIRNKIKELKNRGYNIEAVYDSDTSDVYDE